MCQSPDRRLNPLWVRLQDVSAKAAVWALLAGVLPLNLLAVGCSPHTVQPVVLPIDPPAIYGETSKLVRGADDGGRWWTDFNDPHLNELMERAFAANLDLRQAFARLEQAEAQLRVARAARRPTLDASASVGRSRQPTPLFEMVTADHYALSLPAGFEIDLWRRLASLSEAARLETAASKEDLKTLYLSLSAQVADLYYLAREQQSQLALTDRLVASYADTLERVESRYQEGLVPALDVYLARQNLATARSRRPPFEIALAAAEHGLAVVLGVYPERDLIGPPAALPLPVFPAALPSMLLARRPDVEARLLRLQASDARVAAAVAERFPALRLTGDAGAQSDQLRDLLGSGNLFWNLLLNLVQPLFDGGRRAAEVDRNRALFQEQLAAYHQAVLSAFREVEDALVAARAGEERLERLAEVESDSAAALQLALEHYLAGLSDYLPVLAAQSLYATAQSQLLTARRQLIAERIRLARALGGDWMEGQVEEDLPATHGRSPS